MSIRYGRAWSPANFGVKLQEKMPATKVPCELVYPGALEVKHPTVAASFIDKLKTPVRATGKGAK